MRILVVEDEKKVATFIKKGLEEENYAVDIASDGEEGLVLAQMNEYDLVLLDIMLPTLNGLEVLRRIRGNGSSVPILILTARDSIEDIVSGLDSGSDDYLTKPFSFAELVARVRALLRRKTGEKTDVLTVSDLSLSTFTRRARRGGREIELTAKEYALLEYFMRNPNRILTRTLISEHVWDYDFDPMTNVIDVYVNYLRKKIDQGFERQLIHTIRGSGYIIKDEP
jgi:heavy metal response regulator